MKEQWFSTHVTAMRSSTNFQPVSAFRKPADVLSRAFQVFVNSGPKSLGRGLWVRVGCAPKPCVCEFGRPLGTLISLTISSTTPEHFLLSSLLFFPGCSEALPDLRASGLPGDTIQGKHTCCISTCLLPAEPSPEDIHGETDAAGPDASVSAKKPLLPRVQQTAAPSPS